MQNQKDIFLLNEADAWYKRNKETIEAKNLKEDKIISKIKELKINPKSILEVGCASGYRLNSLQKEFNAECYGIDPSSKAINDGKLLYPNIHLSVNDAASINFASDFFDLIIFGFSLYLFDRDDLFKVAYLADRSLKDSGHMIIYDFYSPINYRNKYAHHEGLYSYKMRNADLFLCHPYYKIILEQIYTASAEPVINYDPDNLTALSILQKNKKVAFIDNPYNK